MEQEKAEQVAIKILKYSRNDLLISLRFMDLALFKLQYKMEDIKSLATNGQFLYFNPKYIFELYKNGSGELNHAHLHTIFHCIFYHQFVNQAIRQSLWNLVCDIAVEGIISELNLKKLECSRTSMIIVELENIKNKYGKLTAESLYKNCLISNITESEILRLQEIFAFDDHQVWYMEDEQNQKGDNSADQNENTENVQVETVEKHHLDSSKQDVKLEILSEWKDISERIKVDIETSSKEWGALAANLMQNITEVNREKYDYSEFLKKFSVMEETMHINDDEFDYIFYTYGLQLYKNVPLVEPLEYKDVKRIKEFVIAIDTSGSVQGALVQKFVNKTYNILSQQNNFFTQINIHIIQCDDVIQQDYKITNKEEFEYWIQHFVLKGFGGTDFRPVFNYVDSLIEKGEFTNLKGLIYFTDGYGTFPNKKPNYETAFVFIDDEYGQPEIPVWAIKLVLASDDI